MTTIAISDGEWAAMRKVDHLARDLYVALRRRMDFTTGIVGGPHAAVSWWALREDTELEGRPGVKACKPTEQQLRRRVGQLEKVGLVQPIGTKLRLRFRLLLAHTGSFVQKKAGGGAVGGRDAGQAKRDKAKRAYPQGSSKPKADTHQESGKTVTHPNPSHVPEGLETSEYPAPHACGAGGELDPQQFPDPGQRLSEERQQGAAGGGDGPAARLAVEGAGSTVAWREDLHWPVGLSVEQRAYLARTLAPVGETLAQRVLDEWRGALRAGAIADPWGYFHGLLRNAKKQGGAWVAVHADKIAEARRVVRERDAQQAAADAKYQASLGAASGPPAGEGGIARALGCMPRRGGGRR